MHRRKGTIIVTSGSTRDRPQASATPTGVPDRVSRSKPPLRRSLLVLAIAIVLLFGAILLLSDVRRQSVPMAAARWYAVQFPALKDPETVGLSTAAARAKVARMQEGAEREPNRKRTLGGLELIGWTRRVPRVLLPDGYAVVFRASDGMHAVWWTTSEFNQRFPIGGD